MTISLLVLISSFSAKDLLQSKNSKIYINQNLPKSVLPQASRAKGTEKLSLMEWDLTEAIHLKILL